MTRAALLGAALAVCAGCSETQEIWAYCQNGREIHIDDLTERRQGAPPDDLTRYTPCPGLRCVKGPFLCDGGPTPYEPCCIDGRIGSCLCDDGGCTCPRDAGSCAWRSGFTACAQGSCVDAGIACTSSSDAGPGPFAACCEQGCCNQGTLTSCACSDAGCGATFFACGSGRCATFVSGRGCPD